MYRIKYHDRELAELMDFPKEAALSRIVQICSHWEISVDLYLNSSEGESFAGQITGNDGGGSRVSLLTSDHIKSQAIAPYRCCLEKCINGTWMDYFSIKTPAETIECIGKVKQYPNEYRIKNIANDTIVDLTKKTF
jgi:hypothetical protein